MPPKGSTSPDTPCQDAQEYSVPKPLTEPKPPLVSGETQRLCAFVGLVPLPHSKEKKYKSGNIKAAVALIVSGVVFPGASGVAAIVLIEYFGVGKRINE